MAELASALSWDPRERVDEAQLVAELQGGSDAAYDWLVTHHHAAVYNLAFGIVADASEAADVTQEVFLKAFRGIGGFRRGSSLKTWLYRIAIREALNSRRWWRRHLRQQTSIDAEHDDGRPVMELEDTAASPFDQLASHETQRVVREALSKVPEVFRTAVILRDLEGLSYEEVAEILEVSVGTVKSRILRGRRALREALAPLLVPPQREAASESSPLAAGLVPQPAVAPVHRVWQRDGYPGGGAQ